MKCFSQGRFGFLECTNPWLVVFWKSEPWRWLALGLVVQNLAGDLGSSKFGNLDIGYLDAFSIVDLILDSVCHCAGVKNLPTKKRRKKKKHIGIWGFVNGFPSFVEFMFKEIIGKYRDTLLFWRS